MTINGKALLVASGLAATPDSHSLSDNILVAYTSDRGFYTGDPVCFGSDHNRDEIRWI